MTDEQPSGPEYDAMLLGLRIGDRVTLRSGHGFVGRIDAARCRIQIHDMFWHEWYRLTASRKTPAGRGLGNAKDDWIVGKKP